MDTNVDRKRSTVILESPTKKKCSVTFWGAKAPLINNIGILLLVLLISTAYKLPEKIETNN